ncbi:unnamed protein product [Kuraishia capsulata CBS 1993]|uniref:Protein AF-9 homolog n=1 Tax=Kuraishia capsulata CBS 1993 TaxID=1382522 RepID=W6MMH7_9ASCO|nr:uncharacterized protein KUCA_T00002103001 [Kuraishia capsulata CBS 1993]CDK26132.1 unnamed protein product [Kuraishia capsulata CBS 1993]
MAPPTTNSKRVKGISISRPILYGNVASPFSEKVEKPAGSPVDHTHLWTVFVRDPNGKDLSYFIKKVVFKLHDTYDSPTRSIESPPFEVTETGWGEFEIGIKIYFVSESSEKNLSLFHHLKLHPFNREGEPPAVVESVLYEEVVFNEPTEKMFGILTSTPGSLLPFKNDAEHKFSKEMEMQELDRLKHALSEVMKQVNEQRDRLVELEKEKKELTS